MIPFIREYLTAVCRVMTDCLWLGMSQQTHTAPGDASKDGKAHDNNNEDAQVYPFICSFQIGGDEYVDKHMVDRGSSTQLFSREQRSN